MTVILNRAQLEQALGRAVSDEEWHEYQAAHSVCRPPHELAERRLGREGERRAV